MRPVRLFLQTFALLGFLVFASCSPSSNSLLPKPDGSNEKVDTDGGTEVFDPQVDILFVVDDSGSMQTHQTNLIRNIDRFLNAFTTRANIDYHIGVINSSLDYWSGANCCGQLLGTPNFVERNTPDLIQVLSRSLRVGTSGSATEKFFDPVKAALTDPLLTGLNAGFYRPNAHLAIVFITDAEDQGKQEALEFFTFLEGLKGRKEKFIAYGVVVPSNVGNCERDDSSTPDRIEDFLGMMPNAGKNVFSLCDPQFGDRIAGIADDLVRFIGNVIFLSRPPIVETIEVSFGTQVIPRDYKKGWVFDPARNALVLGDEIQWSTQPNGTKVKVYYEAATFPKD
jgi:hypothetical protein